MDRTSYSIFIDESGKSALSDSSGKEFILCSLIIDNDLNIALSRYMLSLKTKSGIPIDSNIHAFDIFEAEKVNGKRFNYKKIDELLSKLLSLVSGADIKSIIVSLDKTPYKKEIASVAHKLSISERSLTKELSSIGLIDFLYEILAKKTILEFGHFLEKEDARGEIIAESRRSGDSAVLNAFLSATESTSVSGSHYVSWSKSSFERMHSLTFQNKKGLNFGLEIADLFAWAFFNKTYGRQRSYPTKAKSARIDRRIENVYKALRNSLIKKAEEISPAKARSVAPKRVSEFSEFLDKKKRIP